MPMQVIAIQAERIKKLKLVNLQLNGGNLVVSGLPGQGKTTLINLLWMAIDAHKAGKKVIQDGENDAYIQITLGDPNDSYRVNVYRKFSEKTKSSTITVKASNGERLKASFLTDLINSLSFDPLEFTRLKGKEQRDMLMKLSNIPLEELDSMDERYNELYSDRTVAKKSVNMIETKLGEKPEKKESVDVSELIKELRDAQEYNERALRGEKRLKELEERKVEIHNEIEALKKELTEVEASIVKGTEFVNEYPAFDDSYFEEINENIKNCEEINKKALAYKNWENLKLDFDKESEKFKNIQSEMDEISEKKKSILENAQWPVKGMRIEEDIIYINEIPLNNCGESEKMQISFAIAMSTFPELKCCRLDGAESLGKSGREAILKMAEENGYQVLMSKVSDDGPGEGEIVIEEGVVQ